MKFLCIKKNKLKTCVGLWESLFCLTYIKYNSYDFTRDITKFCQEWTMKKKMYQNSCSKQNKDKQSANNHSYTFDVQIMKPIRL